MNRPIVVLSIHGGMLQDVFSSEPAIRALLVDWDTEGRSADEPHIVEISDSLGRASLAYVAEYTAAPLAGLTGVVAEALSASDFAGDGEFAAEISRLLGRSERAATRKAAGGTVAATVPCARLLQRLVVWYDAEDCDDDALESIVMAARYEVQRLN